MSHGVSYRDNKAELYLNSAIVSPFTQIDREQYDRLKPQYPDFARRGEEAINLKGLGSFLSINVAAEAVKNKSLNYISTDAQNIRSAAIARKFGMKKEY
ncbi:hypothetical protein THF5G08_230037 [Vibrio jasicida]|nr:hypothetical protein THF5G08_230037 [Vibrio jasicida]